MLETKRAITVITPYFGRTCQNLCCYRYYFYENDAVPIYIFSIITMLCQYISFMFVYWKMPMKVEPWSAIIIVLLC